MHGTIKSKKGALALAMSDKKQPPSNDNTSKGHDTARKNFEAGKSPRQTRDDLSRQRAAEKVKPVDPKKK